jgi:hypothetical protein
MFQGVSGDEADHRGGGGSHVAHKSAARLRESKGRSTEIAAQRQIVVEKVWDSEEFKKFMNRRGFDMVSQSS